MTDATITRWYRIRGLAAAGVLTALGPTITLAWPGGPEEGTLPPATTASPAAERAAGAGPEGPPRLEVKGEPTPGAYVLRVQVGGGRPEAVLVVPRGQALDLSLNIGGSADTGPDETMGTIGRTDSYQGAVRRRVPLPADADLKRLTREVSGDTLLLRIPRRSAPAGRH